MTGWATRPGSASAEPQKGEVTLNVQKRRIALSPPTYEIVVDGIVEATIIHVSPDRGWLIQLPDGSILDKVGTLRYATQLVVEYVANRRAEKANVPTPLPPHAVQPNPSPNLMWWYVHAKPYISREAMARTTIDRQIQEGVPVEAAIAAVREASKQLTDINMDALDRICEQVRSRYNTIWINPIV
jgi:hypothetical protein